MLIPNQDHGQGSKLSTKVRKAENFENRKSKQVICDMRICFTSELSHVCNQSLLLRLCQGVGVALFSQSQASPGTCCSHKNSSVLILLLMESHWNFCVVCAFRISRFTTAIIWRRHGTWNWDAQSSQSLRAINKAVKTPRAISGSCYAERIAGFYNNSWNLSQILYLNRRLAPE